jgi:hypothetical protein
MHSHGRAHDDGHIFTVVSEWLLGLVGL